MVFIVKIDFLICGAPNDAFYSQIAFFRLCLDALGGQYKQARLVSVFGHETIDCLPERWGPHFVDIDTVWVTGDDYDSESYNSQHYVRFERIREDADFVVICDADVTLMSTFCDLLDELKCSPAISGTIAHFPPWAGDRDLAKRVNWDVLSDSLLNRVLDKPYKYTLMEPEESPDTPFYINYGVMISTPAVIKVFHENEAQLRSKVASMVGHWWCAQLSLTLTCAQQNLPVKALPMRYNFPNDLIADQLYADELDNIVFLHYLRTDQFDRHKIFTSSDEFSKFLNLELHGSNKVMQDHVINITKGRYPF